MGRRAPSGQPAPERGLGTARARGLREHRSGCRVMARNHGKFPDGKMGKARKYSPKGNGKSFVVWERTSLKVTAQF